MIVQLGPERTVITGNPQQLGELEEMILEHKQSIYQSTMSTMLWLQSPKPETST